MGISRTGYALTKALGEYAEKNAEKIHRKRMAEIKSGKRKRYAGESFNCTIIRAYKRQGIRPNPVTSNHGRSRRRRRRRSYQRGGILPFLIPAAILAAKVAATGGISGAAG